MLNPATTIDDDIASEVCLTGRFRAVDWVTRTAQFHDDDGATTTVRFTPEQDGWMRLVANVPVNLKGTMRSPADANASRNGRRVEDSVDAPEHGDLQLIEVKVPRANWEPYDEEDLFNVTEGYVYHRSTHRTFDIGMSVNEFMRLVRGPDYEGSEI